MNWPKIISVLSTQIALSLSDFYFLVELAEKQSGGDWSASLPPGRVREFMAGKKWVGVIETLIEQIESQNIEIVHPMSASYPQSFFRSFEPPLFLTLMGPAAWIKADLVTVVGSREPTEASLSWLDYQLPDFLRSGAAWVVVSGAARGVDQKAHSLALRCGQPTIAILPAGLLTPYPREFIEWYRPIQEMGGAIMSEYLPHSHMRKHFFIRRNRLIAALGKFCFIVEARRKSGSLLTAKIAADLGRPLCALPGHPLDFRSLGTTDLIYDGVQMIRDGRDLQIFADSLPSRDA